MKIAEIINRAQECLDDPVQGRLQIEVLLSHCLGCRKEDLFIRPEFGVDSEVEKRFWELLGRSVKGEPVAYLTGKKEFYGMEFYVDENVLIPRPETEMLVDEVLDLARKGDSILDVGTGSGCIAIALAKKLDDVSISAVDVSEDALEVARKNAERYSVEVDFRKSNLLENVEGNFDIVVTNLPYVSDEDEVAVAEYEPHGALFGGENGLRLYERLFEQVERLNPRVLLGEFGFGQGDAIRVLLNKYFTQGKWHIKKDYANIERIFIVQL